jgi:hypothetical protein
MMELGNVLGLDPQSWFNLMRETIMKTTEGRSAKKYSSNNRVKSKRPLRQMLAKGPSEPSQRAKPACINQCWPTGAYKLLYSGKAMMLFHQLGATKGSLLRD